MSSTIRYLYCPLFLLGVNGTGVLLVASGASPFALVVLLMAAVAASFVAERVAPYNPEWNRSHDDASRDTLHALVNEAANFSTLLILPLIAPLFSVTSSWPTTWPFWLQVVVAILVLDAGVTLAHFASHRVPVLWRFHAVHHSVKRMYGFNGLMKHPVHQSIETFAGTTPLIVLGLPGDVATALVFCVAVQLLLQHSNVDYRIGPLRYLLATNEVHRFHHQKSPELGDVNFGLFTTLWDHLLGTFHYEERARFASDELGIGAQPDYPRSYVAQLLEPFRGVQLEGAPALVHE